MGLEFLLVSSIVNGLILGGIYALITLGLNMIYGVMKVVNFAHGEFLMMSMYSVYWLYALYHINPYISMPVSIATAVVLAILTERILIEPVLEKPEINQLLITAALSLFLQNFALLLWTADFRGTDIPLHSLTFGNVTIGVERLYAFLVAIPVSFLLYFFLMKTRMGLSIRAVAQDIEGAKIRGINTRRIYIITFIIAGILVGIAGSIILPVYYVFPQAGVSFGLMAWIIMIFGGLGSYEGAFIGSLIIGVIEATAATFTSAELGRAFAFAAFIIVLLLKPEGLLSRRARV